MKTMKLLPLLLLLMLPAVAQAQWLYTINDGTITITNYTGSDSAVSVPGTINGLPVTAIGYAAFYDSSVTSVTIPNSVTSIDNEAFNYCLELTTVTIGTGVTNIGAYAFYNCLNLEDVYFQGNAPDANDAFFGDALTVYYLPGTTNWESFAQSTGLSTVLWNPQAQTGPGFGVQTNQFGFNIIGTSNLVIVVEACTNLADPGWIPLTTNTLTGGSSYFSDPEWANFPSRFYRFSSP